MAGVWFQLDCPFQYWRGWLQTLFALFTLLLEISTGSRLLSWLTDDVHSLADFTRRWTVGAFACPTLMYIVPRTEGTKRKDAQGHYSCCYVRVSFGLSCVVVRVILSLTVLTQYRRVMDGQTDRQTDTYDSNIARQKPLDRTSPIFLHMVPTAKARPFSDGVMTRCLFPVCGWRHVFSQWTH